MKNNLNNTDKCDYNCGGYALETFDWYRPRIESLRCTRKAGATIESCVDFMLEDFPNLRKAESIDDVKENEYLIAFRLGEDDFHFLKRAKNHHWYHKRGASYYIDTIKQEQVFSTTWFNKYDGEIALLAMKR